MTQLAIDFGMTRPSDPDTCHSAAQNVLPRVQNDRERVRAYLEAVGVPQTDFEIAAALGGLATSLGKRRLEIGAVDSGLRRPSPSGSAAICWRLP